MTGTIEKGAQRTPGGTYKNVLIVTPGTSPQSSYRGKYYRSLQENKKEERRLQHSVGRCLGRSPSRPSAIYDEEEFEDTQMITERRSSE